MKFKESALAHKYLDGLRGIEIGGAAHNPFGLDTINIDKNEVHDEAYVKEQLRLCGEIIGIDVVSNGDDLPFDDNSYDFVISSHVIEHFYDPIKALLEWHRVATKYLFMIVPHKDRTFDQDKMLTTLEDLIYRNENPLTEYGDKHWSIWVPTNFMELMEYLYMDAELFDPDDKVGNGFTVIVKI